jgi:hypothetical protein
VPQQADTSALPQAEKRLIQSPLPEDERDEHSDVISDWESYVTSSLQEDLASDLECYTADLALAHRLTVDEIDELFDLKEESQQETDEDEADQDDIVTDDVGEMKGEEEPDRSMIYAQFGFYDLLIPADHQAAWYSALNQARLVMHERHRFPEENEPFTDDEDDGSTEAEAERDKEEPNSLTPAQLARRQAYQAYQFYAQVQMILLSTEDMAKE